MTYLTVLNVEKRKKKSRIKCVYFPMKLDNKCRNDVNTREKKFIDAVEARTRASGHKCNLSFATVLVAMVAVTAVPQPPTTTTTIAIPFVDKFKHKIQLGLQISFVLFAFESRQLFSNTVLIYGFYV